MAEYFSADSFRPVDTIFQYKDQKISEADWPDFQYDSEVNTYKRQVSLSCDGITFQGTQEYFFPSQNPNLALFRQIWEASEDCCFHMESLLKSQYEGQIRYLSQEDNSCGILNDEEQILMTETTQLLSSSMRVVESREDCRRIYEITAWKETPVKMEKFIAVRCIKDTELFQEVAFAECRLASRLGFEGMRSGKTVTVHYD